MKNVPVLLSEIEFGAFLAYSPQGQSEMSVRSRRVFRDGVKNDTPPVIRRIAERLAQDIQSAGLGRFLNEQNVLVPVPRRAPLRDKSALWPARRICEELVRVTLGREVVSCLERWKAVPKSACARPGERPEPEIHFESMRVVSTVFRPQRITVVDDFVTKGATLLAAVSRVQAAFPDSSVRGFALVRTRGLVPEVERILDPCVGRITCRGGVVRRDP